MIKRFQIEGIVSQDASGVTYHAYDEVGEAEVEVRRFFPFGAEGRGLNEVEVGEYESALQRVVGVKYVGLRAVIAGGCDPVDGMPYLATERVDGLLLSDLIANGSVTPEVVKMVVKNLLESSQVLSSVFQEESIWVDTNPQNIIWDESERGPTFWISLQTWLGMSRIAGYEPVAYLVEQMMGWGGRPVADLAGGGLGGWLKWLRSVSAKTPIKEVLKSLQSVGVANVAPPMGRAVTATKPMASTQATKPATKPVLATATKAGTINQSVVATGDGTMAAPEPKKSESKTVMYVAIGLVMVMGLGVLYAKTKKKPALPQAGDSSVVAQHVEMDHEPKMAADSPSLAPDNQGDTVVLLSNRDKLRACVNKDIVLEAKVEEVKAVGNTVKLKLSIGGVTKIVKVSFRKTMDDLSNQLVEKRWGARLIRVRGKLDALNWAKEPALQITVDDYESIQAQP